MNTNTKTPEARQANLSDKDQIHEGDVRIINGVPVLVLRPWMDNDETGEVYSWLVCPVKPVTGDDNVEPSGSVCFVQAERFGSQEEILRAIFEPDPDDPTDGCGYALPGLSCSLTPRFIGKLLYRILPEQRLNAARCWWSQIDVPKGPYQWDFQNPMSQEDWDLVNTMCGPDTIAAMMEDEAKAAEEERRAMEEEEETAEHAGPLYDSHDSWGPVCSGCQWSDQAHKPCAACKGP